MRTQWPSYPISRNGCGSSDELGATHIAVTSTWCFADVTVPRSFPALLVGDSLGE
jgi:hypothetical protein